MLEGSIARDGTDGIWRKLAKNLNFKIFSLYLHYIFRDTSLKGVFFYFIKIKREMEAQKGNSVKVHYTGRLKDGTVFDSSENREPLEFKLGEGMMIAGFEKAVIGMQPGEKKTAEMPVEEGYGQPREEMMIEIEKSQVPADITPEVGMQLSMSNAEGQPIPVKITSVKDNTLILDANHPLAGQDLVFDIEVVEVQ